MRFASLVLLAVEVSACGSSTSLPPPTPLAVELGDPIAILLDVAPGSASAEAVVVGPGATASGPFEVQEEGHRLTGRIQLTISEDATDLWLLWPFVAESDGAPNNDPRPDTALTALAPDGLRGAYLGDRAAGETIDVAVALVDPLDTFEGPIRIGGWLRTGGLPSYHVELEDALRDGTDGWYVSRNRPVYSGDGYAVVPGAQEGSPTSRTIGVARAGRYDVWVRQISAIGEVRVGLSLGDLSAELTGTDEHGWAQLGQASLPAGEAALELTPIGEGRLGLDALVLVPEGAPGPEGSGIDALGAAIDPAVAGSSMPDAMSARLAAASELDREALRAALREAFGLEPLPTEVPDSEVVSTLDDGPCELRLVWFEGGSGPVPANLYVPRDAPDPLPAILNPIGHWTAGKALADEQIRTAAFCRLGFVSMTFDTFWQGERAGVDNDHFLGTFDALGPVPFSGMVLGESVRAVSFLASLPEVDPARIGVTGASGGGMVSAYVAAIDDRVVAAAPVVYTTDYEWLVFDSLGGDPDQIPFGAAALAPLPLLFATFAPRPLLFIAADGDGTFPPSIAGRVFETVQGVYESAGAADRVRLEIVGGPHGYLAEARRLAYDFFLQELADGGGVGSEPDTEVRPASDLEVDPPDLQSLVALHERTADTVVAHPDPDRLSALLDVPDAVPGPARIVSDLGTVRRFALDVDGGREVSAVVIGPETATQAVVAISDGGMAGSALVPWMIGPDRAVVLVEPTGIATQAGRYRSARGTSWSKKAGYLGGHPLLVGLSGMALRRVETRAAAALARDLLDARQVILCGEGLGDGGAAIAIGAAEPTFDAVVAASGFASYREVARSHRIVPPALVARRLLEVGDLPHLAAMLGSRPLLILRPADSTGAAMAEDAARAAYEPAVAAGTAIDFATDLTALPSWLDGL
ncbi:MAG: acetylxylan esterase [Deltaproteobacteria bacterium]|nr:acetylxylan esterase [Deltaproteobacteria bacterium]